MARKRMIDPSFWVDEKLGTVEPRVRLLFMGLISQADDEGRLNGHPALIRSLIYAYDYDITVENIEGWLAQLAERSLILRYEIHQQKYISVINFKKHQTINRPQASKLPEPLSEQSVNDTGMDIERSRTDHAQKKLIEVNLREGEVKGSEGAHAPDNGHKERLRILCNQMNIAGFTLYTLDTVYSYIGMADIEVIEAAIKKSQNKPHSYLTNTLEGMVIRDKITRVEQLFPARSEKHEEYGRRAEGVRPGSHSSASNGESITGGQLGWIGKNNVIPLQGVQG